MTTTLEITLKKDISDLLEKDPETKLSHTNFVGLTPTVEALLGKKVQVQYLKSTDISMTSPELSEEDLESLKYLASSDVIFFLQNEDDSLIHNSWVETIGGEKLLTPLEATASFIKVSQNLLLDTANKTLVNAADVKRCTECGSPLDTHSKVYCASCLTKKYFNVQNHSYKPTLIFHGSQTGAHAKANPTWYGLELEYGLNSKIPMSLLISEHPSELFLKSDSSIKGGSVQAEMVSQPASFNHLMSKDSWVNKLKTLSAVNNPDTNGCHIHVSRTAFKDNKHYAKFKFLMQESTLLVELIGGRKLNSYCGILANKQTMFKTMKEGTSGEKYALCNECHKDTIELRFMASTDKPEQVKRYIQYIDSLIKYTAYYGASASYTNYFAYVTKYRDIYPQIHSLLEANQHLLVGEVTYKQPTFVEEDLENLPAKAYSSITQLKLFDVNGYSEGQVIQVSNKFRLEIDPNSGKIKEVIGISLKSTSKVLATYAKI